MAHQKKNQFKTDWDAYYKKPAKLSSFSRGITARIILDAIAKLDSSPKKIGEIGGANSCFYDAIRARYPKSTYLVIDNNKIGLNLLEHRIGRSEFLQLIEDDVLHPTIVNLDLDMVFSVGLIEHFAPNDTAQIIKHHFALAGPGAMVIITFPTPTLLYRIARKISEALGLWIFHDERPLKVSEVLKEVQKYAEVTDYFINWKIVFTQGVIISKAIKAGKFAKDIKVGAV